MDSSRQPVDLELLLEHGPWMRRLARTLVADPEHAEELSQETWKRILEHPPRASGPFRGWIATVMRNLLRAERRGASRRAQRERASARDEAEPSSHALLERVALQREVVQAVLVLDEPYRTTILLRYFEERTPAEIAARDRVPVATVKTRLARGIARLRERLGRTHGTDGTNLLAALIRIEGVPAPAAALPWSIVPLAMNAKLLASLAVLVAAGVAYFYATREDAAAATEHGGATLLAAPAAAEPVPPRALVSETPADARESLPAEVRASAPAEHAPVASVPAARIRGRVITTDDAPVPEVEIALSPLDSPIALGVGAPSESAPVVARTALDGTFELPGRRQGRLFVRDARWTTLLTGVPVDALSGQECQIVVAPAVELSGVVIDASGAPIERARIVLEPPADLRARLARVLDFSAGVVWRVESDAAGRFHFPAAPALADGVLRAEREGYESTAEPAPLAARGDIVLVLARPESERTLRGLVVDPAGVPVEDALVSHGLDTVHTDAEGHFAFALDDADSLNRRAAGWMTVPDDELRALKRGFLPAELRASERTTDGRPRWPAPLVLRLGGETLAIAGRVLDEKGEPLADLRVWIADPALFGAVRDGPDRDPRFVQTEALLGGAGQGWTWVETDDDGAFELAGLTDRDYTVAAMDPATLLRTVEPVVHAGRRDVVVVLRTGDLFPELAGQVVDSRGAPIAGVAVFPMCDALETRFAGEVVGTQHEALDGTVTDAEGRFELLRVPRDLAYLRLQGNETIPLEWGRGTPGGLAKLVKDNEDALVIAVERRCHFQVELTLPTEGDELGVLDAEGNVLVISEFLGNGRRDTERHPLRDGRSNTLAVGDRAATLVLYRGGVEVRRVPLQLDASITVQLKL